MKPITRKRQKAGDILEIYIEEFGYVYFKLMDIRKVKPDSSYPFMIRVYKTVYKKPIENISDLGRDLLFAPITISAYNGMMKLPNIRIIANEEEINDDEKILPEVKRGSPPFVFGYEGNKYDEFWVLKDLGDVLNVYMVNDYQKVRHLEWAGAMNIIGIPFRIKLELLKLEGKDIKEENGLKDWHEELIYEMTKDLPIYSRLDPKTRDFAYN